MLAEVEPDLHLWQGSASEDGEAVRRAGVRWCLDLAGAARPAWLPAGCAWCCRVIPDGPGVTLPWLQETVGLVLEALRHGPALVICGGGVSRSSLVTAAVIMAMEELPSARAVAALRARKPDANPHPYFLDLLAQYGRTLGVES
jgi:hypothetical protein